MDAFEIGFAFANERSAGEFDEQRSTFFRSNERYDHYLEIREGLDLVGVNFQEYMISVGDSKYNPWYSNQYVFWAFSVALLSWPIRILLEYNTAYVNYQVCIDECTDTAILTVFIPLDRETFWSQLWNK